MDWRLLIPLSLKDEGCMSLTEYYTEIVNVLNRIIFKR